MGRVRATGGKQALTDAFSYKPPRVVHRGIKRLPPRAPSVPTPLTARHEAVLAALATDRPTGQTQIAHRTGLSTASVASALYLLDKRGLARHIGFRKGWVRA